MKKKPKPQTIYAQREYKYDKAMQEAVRRSAWHPKPVSMTTKVGEFTNSGGNK